MIANPLRRLPALALFVVLGLLPLQAWLGLGGGRLVAGDETDGVRGVTWVGSVSPEGRLSVRITYDLGDETERTLDVRVPDGARFLAVDGVPVAADIGKYADDVPVSGTATVTYELPGAVTRHGDGALLRLVRTGDGYLDGDASLFPCPRCYIEPAGYGDVPVDGAIHYRTSGEEEGGDVPLWTTGLDSLRVVAEPGVVRFVGVGDGDAVALLAVLPAGAVPDAPLADGAATAAVDRVRTDVAAVGERLRAPSSGDGAGVAVALVLTALYAALVAWAVWRMRRARRDRDPRADEPVPVGMDAIDTRPSGLEPALAAFTVGGAGGGDRSAVAGTLLELARRDVIEIDGIDSRRFTLTIPPGARGSTPFEEAVLARLRPQGQITARTTMTGPPLWGPEGPAVARSLGRLLAVQAFRQRLARLTLSVLVLVPVSIAMGVIAVVASEGRSALAWFALLGGPLLALLAAFTSGVSLTATGREERRRWLAYADWLRTNTQLADVGVPGVAIWGEVLPHAAALGAAPVAAEALSPR
jgi:uncharacterized protein (TIGR04222 family)